MNVCAPRETAYQRRLVDEGRARLLAHWATDAYRAGQPAAFRVAFSHEIAIRGDPIDVFVLTNAGAALPAVWHRDAEARALPIESAGARNSYYALVRRAEHARGRAPFAVDGSLLARVGASLGGALVFGAAAYALAVTN